MLYVVHGNDVVGVRKRAHELLLTFEPGAGGVREMTHETFSTEELQSLAGAASLFSVSDVVLLDTLSGDTNAFESFLEHSPILAESQNVFVVIEGTLRVPEKKLLAEHAEKMIEVKGAQAQRFNTFALADAFLRRDKKSLWILLTEAWRNGVTSEEIIGTLFWQLKILRLSEHTKSAAEAEQKPYVYDKAKRALPKFKSGELTKLSRTLVNLYHDGHEGKRDINIALETWVLTL